MFFTIYMGIVALLIVVASVVAIVMSTSQGSRWLQSAWQRFDSGTTSAEDEPPRS